MALMKIGVYNNFRSRILKDNGEVDAFKRKWDPEALRDPKTNAERREALKSQPNTGTWPFTPSAGGAE